MWGTSPTFRERPEDAHAVNVRDAGGGVKLTGLGSGGRIWYVVLGTWYGVRSSYLIEPGTWYFVLGTEYQVLFSTFA